MMWVKAYDAAGNVSSAMPATTTFKAFTDYLNTYHNIDLDLSTRSVVWGGSLRAGTKETPIETKGIGIVSKTFDAGRGLITATAPSVLEPSGVCASGSVQLTSNYYGVVASDQIMDGECRELRLTYMATEPGSYTIRFQQDSTQEYNVKVNHPGYPSAAFPYTGSIAISEPTVTAGPLKSVKLTVNDSKPTGTAIKYWVSANDGITWQQITPGIETQLNHGGRKLRLRADLTPAAGSGSAWANLTPEVLDWSAEMTQFIPKNMVTVSQTAPPSKLTASLSNTTATVQWQGSATPGVSYNVYRSTKPHPEGEAYLVARGVTGTSLTESSNLLKNSSFERDLTGWNPYWYGWYSIDNSESWAGLKSVRLNDYGYYDNGFYQYVTTQAAAGTTFTLRTQVKGQNVVESIPEALGIRLQYEDSSWSTTTWGSIPGGTFDWTPAQISMIAAKPVKQAQVILRHHGRGTIWFDGVQFDTRGATFWNDGDLEKSKVYYYLVTAVGADGVESAPSNEASTGTAVSTVGMLGVKGFWPYSNVPLAGGSGYVNLASGNLAYAATDLVYHGRGLTTAFRRTYNSQGAGAPSTLGNGWDHNFNWKLSTGAGGARILKKGDGATFTFAPTGDGQSYNTPPGARMRLVRRADSSHTLVRHDINLFYEFDGNGKLLRIAEPNGNALTLTYNADGTLSQVIDPTGSSLSFAYEGGLLTRVTHPGQSNWQVLYRYDVRGNLIQVTDLEGQDVYYGYDENNRLVQVTDVLGRSTQLAYSGMPGVVQQVIYPDTTEQTFSYGAVGDQTGWLRSTVTDARGFEVTYQVDANGLLKRQTFPYGTPTPAGTKTGTVSFEHDAAWNVTKYTDPLGGVYTIAYDGYGNTLSVTDPLGSRSAILWTTKPYPGADTQVLNVVAQQTDALNQTTVITTDSRGNVIQIQDPLLHVTEFSYNEVGLRTTAKDANRHVTTYAYDSKGWLLAQTNPVGGTTRYTYDAAGNPAAITDAAGNVTRYSHDRLGRQVEATHANGSSQVYVYDGAGNILQSTDPGGATTRYEYDSRNRVVTLKRWPNAGDSVTVYTTRYEYDSMGLPITVTDPLGKRSTTTYDGGGRTLTSANPLGDTITYTYDAAGNVTQIKDPLGNTVTAEYDKLNRRTKTVVPQDSGVNMEQIVTYDVLGRTTAQKDGLGNTTTYHYDALGQLALVVDPMGFGTTYAYDAVGNRLAVTDAQRRTTQYVYDAANRVVEEKRPDGVSVLTNYDQAGRVISTTNGRNQTIGYRYDNMNRLVETIYPSGENVRYTYDAMGRRTSMADWNGTTRYHYNLLGWMKESIDPWGHQVSYDYDAAGNRTRMTLHYAGVDFNWTYAYDDAGRVKSLQSPGVPQPDTFTYDKAGRMDKLSYANGDTVDHTFNKAGDLKSIYSRNSTESTFLQFTYYFDKAGRRTNIDRSVSGLVRDDVFYKYDAGSRVTTAGPNYSANNREYYYDLVGNRHTMVVNSGEAAGVYTYVYDPFNRLLEEFGPVSTNQGGGRYHKSQTYDGEGSLTRAEKDDKEVTLYYYDEESRLVQVTDPVGQITRYTYNGDGQRVSMTEARGKTFFIYDGTEVLAEADATGTIKIAYSRMPGGRLVSQWQGGETFWYHLDGLGSTIAMTDESGKIRNRYGYDEYGNPTNATSEQIFNRYTFTGQAWDAGVGLYHYKARYYNPQAGRFLTQDTYKGSPWQPWTQNLYTYVGNNPVRYTDPTGHAVCEGAINCHEATESVPSPDSASADEAIVTIETAEAADLATDTTVLSSKWYDLPNGWRARVDPPKHGAPGAKTHVHVYPPRSKDQAGSWNDDGTISHEGKGDGKVPKKIKEAVEEKTGIKSLHPLPVRQRPLRPG